MRSLKYDSSLLNTFVFSPKSICEDWLFAPSCSLFCLILSKYLYFVQTYMVVIMIWYSFEILGVSIDFLMMTSDSAGIHFKNH